jgi:hypothetical protein
MSSLLMNPGSLTSRHTRRQRVLPDLLKTRSLKNEESSRVHGQKAEDASQVRPGRRPDFEFHAPLLNQRSRPSTLAKAISDSPRSWPVAPAEKELETAYEHMPPVDFSRQVMAPQPHRPLTVRHTASGWGDLGSPDRVINILARNNIQPPWLHDVGKPPGAW